MFRFLVSIKEDWREPLKALAKKKGHSTTINFVRELIKKELVKSGDIKK